MALGGEISLREFMELRYATLEDKIDALGVKMDRLTAQESRILALEQGMRVLKWLGSTLMAIVMALLVAALKGWLGL